MSCSEARIKNAIMKQGHGGPQELIRVARFTCVLKIFETPNVQNNRPFTFFSARKHPLPSPNWIQNQDHRFWTGKRNGRRRGASDVWYPRVRGTRGHLLRSCHLRNRYVVRWGHLLRPVSAALRLVI